MADRLWIAIFWDVFDEAIVMKKDNLNSISYTVSELYILLSK